MGFKIEDDLNTENSRKLWLEWKRRTDPDALPRPRRSAPRPAARGGSRWSREGLSREEHFYGTINCDGINAKGEICGVTTTSGLAWKIPGRVGDSPILGAGLYVDNAVGAAGSTGRGEANLYNLSSFLIVEEMRRGMRPRTRGMEALKRIKANTVEKRLLNSKGNPNFNIQLLRPQRARRARRRHHVRGREVRRLHRRRPADAQLRASAAAPQSVVA